jgi:hypothetical protein
MIAISNAFFYQLEVVQKDRWSLGPLEIAFVGGSTPPPSVAERIKLDLALNEWNRTCAGGDIRPRDTFEVVAAHVPGIEHRQNPNIIFAPLTEAGNSELHVMLASLLPDAELHAAGLERSRANISLLLAGRYQLPRSYAPRVEQAFARYIWSKIAPARRYDPAFFSRQSPLRLLAGDARFWMQRIYRIGLDRRETCFTPTTHENGGWKPLEELRAAVYESIPEETASGTLSGILIQQHLPRRVGRRGDLPRTSVRTPNFTTPAKLSYPVSSNASLPGNTT